MNLKNNRGLATLAAILLGAGIALLCDRLWDHLIWPVIKTKAGIQ
jgi:hypothetical protein